MKKKLALILLIIMILTLLTASIAYAGDLTTRLNDAKGKIISTLQDGAKIAAAVFACWAGFIFWGAGGDPNKKAAAKEKLAYACIAFFFIFGCEDIVNTILSWFGVS